MNSDVLDIFEHLLFCTQILYAAAAPRWCVRPPRMCTDHSAGAHRRRGLLSVDELLDSWCPRSHRSQMGQYPWLARGVSATLRKPGAGKRKQKHAGERPAEVVFLFLLLTCCPPTW